MLSQKPSRILRNNNIKRRPGHMRLTEHIRDLIVRLLRKGFWFHSFTFLFEYLDLTNRGRNDLAVSALCRIPYQLKLSILRGL